METVDVRGRFVWHQLMTRDVPGARKFYSKFMGWKTQPWPPDPAYTVCQAGDVPVAGIIEIAPDLPAEVPSHWLQYIGTRDVDGTADAAVRAGGSVVNPPSDLKGAGRYAVLKDPQGALFAVIDPENARPDQPGMSPLGAFSWHELATSDHEAAFAFYSGLFGWEAMMRMDMGPNGIYLIFGANGVQLGGMYIKPPDFPAPPNWLPYGNVSSVDESAGELEAAGARIVNPPMEVPGGSRIATFIDPTGAEFAINSTPATTVAAPARTPKPRAKPKAKPKSKPKAKPKSKPKVEAKAVKKRVSTKVVKKSKSKPKAKTRAKAKVKSKMKKSKSARRKK